MAEQVKKLTMKARIRGSKAFQILDLIDCCVDVLDDPSIKRVKRLLGQVKKVSS